MRIRDLTGPDVDVAIKTPSDDALEQEVTGLSADSREIKPGFIFVALEGTRQDGLDYLPAALAQGAAAVLVKKGRSLPGDLEVPVLQADVPRKALAWLAARLMPGAPETIAAVTGTNGKTSVATFLRQIWSGLGLRAASMGTLGVMSPDGPLPLIHTTPDPVTLHQVLKALHDTGTTHLVLEASSHGLAQDRLEAVFPQAAGFTNLTRDHLDYHGSFEAYRDAKAQLFTERLAPRGTAVINLAGSHAPYFVEKALEAGRAVMTVGTPDADLALRAADPVSEGLEIALAFGGERYTGTVPLFGAFQAENVSVALGLALALGADFDKAAALTAKLQGAPGRLERVGQSKAGAPIFVDYAHTPDALDHVLKALRPHAARRLHVVFGCGGDRDRGKRREMGAIAAAVADDIVVTDDNPRSEDPAAIRRAVLEGCPDAREVGDRDKAIRTAIQDLGAGDVLVVAGKGHETGQIIGDRVLPFNDGDVVRQILQQRKAARG